MGNVKTIKDVDDATWAEFKSLASRNRVKLGAFFKTVLDEYEKNADAFWDEVLRGEKILSDAEAKALESAAKRIRKEYGFRQ